VTPPARTDTKLDLVRCLQAGRQVILDLGAGVIVALRPQAVQGAVRLAHGADEAAQRHRGELTGVHAISVDVANVDLNAGLVLGLDQAVGRRAASTRGKHAGD
jgi:hypothetical protein